MSILVVAIANVRKERLRPSPRDMPLVAAVRGQRVEMNRG